MRVPRLYGFALLTCSLLFQPSSDAQPGLASEVSRLVQLLELSPESTVADLGAGSGEVSVEIARQLGAQARVYSTDINSVRLEEIKKAAATANLTNVTVVEGAPAATNLPDECCDAIFVRYVYHHFGDPPAMKASILRSLKPGGRFAVMDAGPRIQGTVPPSERASGDKHGVVQETVVEELDGRRIRDHSGSSRLAGQAVLRARKEAALIGIPAANLYMFLSHEADVLREVRAFAATLTATRISHDRRSPDSDDL